MTDSLNSREEMWGDIAKASGVLGGGAALAAFIAHKVKKRRDEADQKKLFKAYVESDSPMIRLEENTADTEQEQKMRALGESVDEEETSKVAVLQKFAQLGADGIKPLPPELPMSAKILKEGPVRLADSGMQSLYSIGANIPGMAPGIQWISDHPVEAAPLLAAASLASLYGGYKGMDWLMGKIDKDESEYNTARKQNLYRSKVTALMKKKYGDPEKVAYILEKAAAGKDVPFHGLRISQEQNDAILAEVDADLQKVAQARPDTAESRIAAEMDTSQKAWKTGMAIYLLASLGLGGIAYGFSKNYFDKKSDAKKRVNQLKAEIKRRAVSGEAPVLLDADFSYLDKAPGLAAGTALEGGAPGAATPTGTAPAVDSIVSEIAAKKPAAQLFAPPPKEEAPAAASQLASKSLLD